jgi:hypothetical protein
LSVVILATGCGGGSSTPKLQITTTSLPNGTVGTPYSTNLAAIGGTPPYTWSQTSGGALPGGLSLGSAGIFAGTPTVAGTFGPYVFVATDSSSPALTASTQSLSITISANTLSVTTSSLPAGTVNSAYSVTLAATGGTAPYTWAETSGGALPPGIAAITSGGVIAGTPTTPGTYGPYVFTVTDAANGTAASGSLSFVVGFPNCTPAGNEAALPAGTPYAFLLRGTDSSGNPVDIAGSFTANGAGGITNAAVDYNGFTNGPEQMQINLTSSSYSFSSTLQGCLSLAFSGVSGNVHGTHGAMPAVAGTSSARAHGRAAKAAGAASLASVQFTFSLGGSDGTVYHNGRIIESDNSGTNASGSMDLQVPAAFTLSGLPPNFAFGLNGWTEVSGGGLLRTAMAGAGTNTAGALSAGYTDINVGGTASGELTGATGTLNGAIDAHSGRGTGTYTIPMTSGNLTFDFAFYVLDGSYYLISTDTPAAGGAPLLSGRSAGANATNAPGALSGFYLLEAQGLDASGTTPGNYAAIATLNTANTGAISIANFYVNDNGVFTTTPYTNATYTVEAASGRVAFTGLTATPPVVYLTNGTANSQIAGFLVGTDTVASSGVIVPSTSAPSLVLSNLIGKYAASNEEDLDAQNGASLGLFSFTGTGQFTATQIFTGNPAKLPGTGSVAISGDGSGNLNSGALVLVTNGDVIFLIATQGDPLLYVLDAATPQ